MRRGQNLSTMRLDHARSSHRSSRIVRPRIEGIRRYDFVHALFEGDYAEADYVEPGYQATSAIRSKTGSIRPVSDLKTIRDRAAALSCSVI